MGILESASWAGVILTCGVIAYHFGLLEDLVHPDAFAARFDSVKTNLDLFSQLESLKPGAEIQQRGPILSASDADKVIPNMTLLQETHEGLPITESPFLSQRFMFFLVVVVVVVILSLCAIYYIHRLRNRNKTPHNTNRELQSQLNQQITKAEDLQKQLEAKNQPETKTIELQSLLDQRVAEANDLDKQLEASTKELRRSDQDHRDASCKEHVQELNRVRQEAGGLTKQHDEDQIEIDKANKKKKEQYHDIVKLKEQCELQETELEQSAKKYNDFQRQINEKDGQLKKVAEKAESDLENARKAKEARDKALKERDDFQQQIKGQAAQFKTALGKAQTDVKEAREAKAKGEKHLEETVKAKNKAEADRKEALEAKAKAQVSQKEALDAKVEAVENSQGYAEALAERMDNDADEDNQEGSIGLRIELQNTKQEIEQLKKENEDLMASINMQVEITEDQSFRFTQQGSTTSQISIVVEQRVDAILDSLMPRIIKLLTTQDGAPAVAAAAQEQEPSTMTRLETLLHALISRGETMKAKKARRGGKKHKATHTVDPANSSDLDSPVDLDSTAAEPTALLEDPASIRNTVPSATTPATEDSPTMAGNGRIFDTTSIITSTPNPTAGSVSTGPVVSPYTSSARKPEIGDPSISGNTTGSNIPTGPRNPTTRTGPRFRHSMWRNGTELCYKYT